MKLDKKSDREGTSIPNPPFDPPVRIVYCFSFVLFGIITVRKRSLRGLCFYACLSVILFTGGSTWAGTPPGQVHPLGPGIPLGPGPPRTRYIPRDQVHPQGPGTPKDQVHFPGTRYTPPWDQVHPLGPGTPPWDQVHPQDQVHPPGPGTPPVTRYTPERAYNPILV